MCDTTCLPSEARRRWNASSLVFKEEHARWQIQLSRTSGTEDDLAICGSSSWAAPGMVRGSLGLASSLYLVAQHLPSGRIHLSPARVHISYKK